MTGVDTGDCLNTGTGEPKLGLASGDTSLSLLPLSLCLLPILGRGLGGFLLPGSPFGLIPGDLRGRPDHLLSQFLLLMVSELRGSISIDLDHR